MRLKLVKYTKILDGDAKCGARFVLNGFQTTHKISKCLVILHFHSSHGLEPFLYIQCVAQTAKYSNPRRAREGPKSEWLRVIKF